ncbi:MAG TPA: glycine cleavage T C-terminal barrel domain-containing protein [Vicinamibacterales bacterium]|nr:glycine cleavage T C-terminal barrel domain-containing protein [Vicinamibacterales bacterium]
MDRITNQYRIIAAGAGWIDRSRRGRLKFEGKDARAFLQALVTNDLDAIAPGSGIDAAYLTPQGRMIAMLRILVSASDLLVDVAPGQAADLATRFDRLIFTEQVTVTDVTEATTAICVVGGDAAGVVARVVGLDRAPIAALASLGHLASGDTQVVRVDDAPLPGYVIWAPVATRQTLIDRLVDAGAVEIDPTLDQALRIEAGRPEFGVDMTDDTIPLEAGLLERAISTTKGCYVGQEVIIRVLHRGAGRVAKRLVRLTFESDVTSPPQAGTPLVADDKETGRITSAAWLPGRDRVIALGYVHRDAATAGARVLARTADGDLAAEITGFAG